MLSNADAAGCRIVDNAQFGAAAKIGEQAWRWPRNRIEAQLAAIWARLLGTAPVSVNGNFFDLGGDSLAARRLMQQVERSLGVRLPIGSLLRAPTVATLAELVAEHTPVAEWDCLVPLQPLGHRPPFFCIHNYNGEVWLYADLARRLAPDQPVYGLQAIGVNRPCAPLRRIELMADRYIAEMQSVQPHGPYYLGGICFGAYVSLEIARQLAERGEEVGLLLSFDTFAYAHEPPSQPALGSAERFRRLRSQLDPSFPGKALRNAGTILHNRLSQLQRRASLIGSRIRLRSRTPLVADTRRELLTALNAKARVMYRPGSYAGKVTIVQSFSNRDKDPSQFWGRVAQQGVECVPVAGDHVSILEGPHVPNLAEVLRSCLCKAQGRAIIR